MVAQVSGNKTELKFGAAQIAKVEFVSDYGALIAVANAYEVSGVNWPVLITGIPAAIASSLMPTRMAGGVAQYISCTVSIIGQPKKKAGDSFYTASYGGRFVVEA